MIVYPAIDLMDGRVVRLSQGRFDQVTTYAADPCDALQEFAAAGAEWAHIVDLDGARAGAPRQHDLLAALAATAPLKLQLAGGIRERDQVARLLDAGAGRVVVGSLAVKAPDLVRAMLTEFGSDRITLALDVHMVDGTPMVATHGWSQESTASLWDIAGLYEGRHMLVTDIGRDGMLTGPNLDLIDQCVRTLPTWQVQASGGVAVARHLHQLRRRGAAGAIVGKALWEGRFTLAEALDHARA
jgi:phosphoribosylformimino-5-aminoimidazole carboxamide ribotide isomerase